MKALTLTQPWAGLVASGIKRIENRPRHMIRRDAIGSQLAVHASREIDETVYQRIGEIAPELSCDSGRVIFGHAPWYRLSRITSAILSVHTLDRIIEAIDYNEETKEYVYEQSDLDAIGDQSRWLFGKVAYVLRDERVLTLAVETRGHQSCWTVPELVAAAVEGQLR